MKTISIIAPQHPISSVVLLKSSKAEVTRTFPVFPEEGRNKIVIFNLPTTIERQSIRVAILDQNGKPTNNHTYLSDIVCSVEDNAVDDPVKDIIRSLEVKKSGLQSEKKMLDTQAEVMVTYARSLRGDTTGPDAVSLFLDAFSERGTQNIIAAMKIEEKLAEIDNSIKEEKRKKSLIKGSANSQLTVVITTDSTKKIRLQMTYVVNNTKWVPSYELHAVTDEDGRPSRMVSLHYRASIKQGTGEDWTDASVTLSTVATNTTIQTIPKLEPVKINVPPQRPTRVSAYRSRSDTPPHARRHSRSRSRSCRRSYSRSRSPPHHLHSRSPRRRHVVNSSPHPHFVSDPIRATPGTHLTDSFRVEPDYAFLQGQAIDDAVLTLSESESVGDDNGLDGGGEGFDERMVTQTPMTLTYRVRGKSDISSDGKEHTVTIAILPFEAEIDYISIPRIDPRVFLECRVKNNSEYRLLPGPVSVILDNNYVSRTQLSDIKRNETFTFALGDDPSIVISYERVSKSTKEGTHTYAEPVDVATYTTTITAHNTHPFPIENLIVRDAVPITGDDQRVKVLLRKPLELVEATEDVFVGVKGGGTRVSEKDEKERECLKVKWKKEEDGLYEYLCGIGADGTAKLETVFEVKAPADLKYSFST